MSSRPSVCGNAGLAAGEEKRRRGRGRGGVQANVLDNVKVVGALELYRVHRVAKNVAVLLVDELFNQWQQQVTDVRRLVESEEKRGSETGTARGSVEVRLHAAESAQRTW